MADDKAHFGSNFAIIAIVGVVAIVGLVVMFSGRSGSNVAITPQTAAGQGAVVEANIVGAASCFARSNGWICCYGSSLTTALKWGDSGVQIVHDPTETAGYC